MYDEELLDKLKSQVSAMKVEKGDLMIQLQKLQSSFMNLDSVLQETKKMCHTLNESVEEVAKCNKAIETQLEVKNNVIKSLKKELQEKQDEIFHHSEEKTRLKEAHEKITMQHCIEESWKYAEIEGLKMQIDLLVEKVSAAESENACLRNQLFRAFEELKLAEKQLRNQPFETVDEKPDKILENEAINER